MLKALRVRLHKNKYPSRYELLQPLLQQQNLKQTQLLEKQQRDRTNMLAFAVKHTDYYKNRYADLLPENLIEFDFERLPILGKDDVVNNRDAMLADAADKNNIRLGYTGGSTGKPLSFYYDNYKMELMRAGMCRSYMWSGWRPGDRILNFWGAKQDIRTHNLKSYYHDYIAAEKTIGAWEYGEIELHKWAHYIKHYRPVLLQGYASILADVANFIIAHKIRMPKSLKGVYSTAEVLYDWQREDMQAAFNCPVYNQYGCREIPNIGVECSHCNMHTFTYMVYLESINIDNEDKLIITSLTNFLMPMIRYENGDNGKLKEGQCACGSSFPMMEMGICRSNDFIKTRSGKKIAPSYFNRLLDGLSKIQQYQFIQTELDSLTLNIESTSKLDSDLLRGIREKIINDIDQDMRVEIKYVDKIRRSKSGKHRFVICAIPAKTAT